jgi:alanine racemase
MTSHRASAVLEIDLAAVAGNWRAVVAHLSPGTECAAVVKADAYGLGMAAVAPVLAAAGCRLFYVAQLEEAIALRALVRDCEIAVLDGFFAAQTAEFLEYRLIPVLNDLSQIAAWRQVDPATRQPAMLHLDTGMSRLGLPAAELARLRAAPALLDGFALRAIMSHLACPDEPGHPLNRVQLDTFRTALAGLPPAPASLSASSGIFLGRDFHFDLARPGAALYGVNPQPGTPSPVAQVIRLKGKILQTREIDTDSTVGYGATYRRSRPGRLAIVAAGYADGLLRSLGNRGTATIAGRQVPIVGRVSMDLLTLDVTDLDPETAQPGSFAELIGPAHDVDALAAEAGTSGYEMLTALGRRYRRIYSGAAS